MPPGNVFPPFLRANPQANEMIPQTAVIASLAGLVGAYVFYKRKFAPAKPNRPIFSSFGFHTLRLHSTEQVNHDTKRLRFELPDPNVPSGLSPTSALLTVTFPNDRWLPVARPYTPVNDLNEPGFIELLVKLYPQGKQSRMLHSLKPGDKLLFAPVKQFAWKRNKYHHLAMIAGGAGITPMFQLIRGVLRDPKDYTMITLVWGVNTDADIILHDELSALQEVYSHRFKVVYVVSEPSAGSPHREGFVTSEVLEAAGLCGRDRNRGVKALICGPPAMVQALKGKKGQEGLLAKAGFSPEQIYTFLSGRAARLVAAEIHQGGWDSVGPGPRRRRLLYA